MTRAPCRAARVLVRWRQPRWLQSCAWVPGPLSSLSALQHCMRRTRSSNLVRRVCRPVADAPQGDLTGFRRLPVCFADAQLARAYRHALHAEACVPRAILAH